MSATRPPVRVVVVDDHPLVVDGLRLALELAGMDVVAVAGTVAEAVEAARQHMPDVIVMDIQLPDGTGIAATRAVLDVSPTTGVLMLTMLDTPDTLHAALQAGARGYVVKGARRDEIVRAVSAVASGEAIFGASMAGHLLAGAAQAKPSRPGPPLTEREQDVLDLVGQGLTNAVIGERLGISAKTVANHVSVLLTKLQVTDRAQAALLASRRPRPS